MPPGLILHLFQSITPWKSPTDIPGKRSWFGKGDFKQRLCCHEWTQNQLFHILTYFLFFFLNVRWHSAIWRCSSICGMVASRSSEYSDIKSFTIFTGGSQGIYNQLLHNGYYLQSELNIPRPARGRMREGKVQELWIKPLDGPTTASLGLESFFVDVGQRLWWSCQKLIFWFSDSERQLFLLLIVLIIIVTYRTIHFQQLNGISKNIWWPHCGARGLNTFWCVCAIGCLLLPQICHNCLKTMVSRLKIWWGGDKKIDHL